MAPVGRAGRQTLAPGRAPRAQKEPAGGPRGPTGNRKESKAIVSTRIYEILFIADPNLGEPEAEALAAQVQGFVEKEGGQV